MPADRAGLRASLRAACCTVQFGIVVLAFAFSCSALGLLGMRVCMHYDDRILRRRYDKPLELNELLYCPS